MKKGKVGVCYLKDFFNKLGLFFFIFSFLVIYNLKEKKKLLFIEYLLLNLIF